MKSTFIQSELIMEYMFVICFMEGLLKGVEGLENEKPV